MPQVHPLWITLVVLVCYSGFCTAFGAGNIPDFAFLEGKAYRHGDIEDILVEMLIRTAAGESDGALDFFKKVVGVASEKFGSLNVKRTYFGNWLRDYSQAVDVGTLQKGLDVATIRVLVWVLGFMSFGYATGEFEVTVDRLGVYRPEEHIDNPKDYADNADARQFDRRLRGPVDPRELQVDPRTGIKNYIANEQGGWATSTRYIRESLLKAIELGRRGKNNEKDMFEALRLLGQALHTLEDLGAHSNWVELALIELGYNQVFPHVGSNTQVHIQGANKRVWPLVTGTFGGTDFIASLLGEATDKLSQTSLTDLNVAVSDAEYQNTDNTFNQLKGFMKMIPTGDASSNLDKMQQSGQAGKGKTFKLPGMPGNGEEMSADQIAKQIYPILEIRDKIMMQITEAMEMIPGLNESIDEITQQLTVFVLSQIEPFIKPIMQIVSDNVSKGAHVVMADEGQYLVWNDSNSSDPTHSMLAKDHFSCYLNDPAGQLAKVIVRNAVTQVVAAWSDNSIDPRGAIDAIMVGFCHPALLNHSLPLHRDMFAVVKNWVDTLPSDKKQVILDGLTKEGVRDGRHHDDERRKVEERAGGHSHSHGPPSQARAPPVSIGGVNISQGFEAMGFQAPAAVLGGGFNQPPAARYGQQSGYAQQSYTTSSHVQNDNTYVQREETYTSTYQPREEYSRKEKHDKHRERSNDSDQPVESYSPPFHRSEEEHRKASYERQASYGQREQSYGANTYGQSNEPSYGERDTTYTSSRETEEPSYGARNDSYNTASYERDEQRSSGYGNNRSYEDTVESFQDLNVRDSDDRDEGYSRQQEAPESQGYGEYDEERRYREY